MKIYDLSIEGLKLVELNLFGDNRGFFVERFNQEKFAENGLPTDFVQLNHSRSSPKVLRGMHYQTNPAQGKLVGVANGAILDVAVDIRPDSKTYGKYEMVELSDMNGKLLWIPAGFAHGFCVLGDKTADVLYNVNAFYNPQSDSGISWDDPEIGIKWPIDDPIISDRDKQQKSFAKYRETPEFF